MNPVDALLNEVRARIRSSRYTQARIARHLGISEKHLSQFMQGRNDLGLNLLRRMCDVLGMSD